MAIRSVKTKDRLNWIYGFCLEWFEDHRKVKRSDLLAASKLLPLYKGIAYRETDTLDKVFGTSWSRSLSAVSLFKTNTTKTYEASIEGIDLEALASEALTVHTNDSDLRDIVKVKEIIALKADRCRVIS